MTQFAREALSSSIQFVPLARPASCFEAVDSEFHPSGPLRRMFSLARDCGVSTLCVEDLTGTDARDLAQEDEDIGKCNGTSVPGRICRLSFFDAVVSNESELGRLEDGSFLGYGIVRLRGTDQPQVYEAVMRMPARCGGFIRGQQLWNCRVGQRQFRLNGYLYTQQNSLTNVCAHVACRTVAARFHPDGDMTYREMNDLLEIDHKLRRTGSGAGLKTSEMCAILEAAGARCEVGAYPTNDPNVECPPFQRLIYGSIESGYPAIVCFATENNAFHAIPIFGHTFNPDLWVHCAGLAYFRIGDQTSYVPSDQWLGAYISHDDNWGPNYCIPQHFLHTRRLCKDWPTGPRPCASQSDRVAYVIATLPKEACVNSAAAEAVGMDFLSVMLPDIPGDAAWKKRLVRYAQSNLLVLRPLLIHGSDYLDHLKKMTDWDHRPVSKRSVEGLGRTPEFAESLLWMVELSVPELFSTNRRKVGEILIRADRMPSGDRDPNCYVLARVPGHFAFYKGEANYKFLTSDAQSHVPLFGCE